MRKIGAILLGLSIALLVGEIVLRLFFPPSTDTQFYVWPPHYHRTNKLLPNILPGVEGESHFIVSSQGIRGDELSAEHTYRILAVGGSTTECLYLDQSESWPSLLQQKLNHARPRHRVWVGIVGRSGFTTRDHIVQLKYLLPQYPALDAVIVLAGVNDFLLRLKQGETYDPYYLDRPESERRLLSRGFSQFPEEFHKTRSFYERAALWRLVNAISNRPSRHEVQDEAGLWYIESRKRRQAATLRNQLPSLTSALEEYSRNITTLAELAKARSVRIIFLTQPVLWDAGLSKELRELCWMGYADRGKEYYTVETLAVGMRTYNEALLKICQKWQLECLDLALSFPKDTFMFYDDMHFNEQGAEKIAEAVFQYMIRRGPFQETLSNLEGG